MSGSFLAPLLVAGLLCYFALVGFALLAWLRRESLAFEVFFAPAIGIALIVVSTVGLSRLGLPVKSFALALLGVVLLLALALLWRLRPKLEWRALLPVIAFVVLAFFLSASPMIQFGFNWESYSNEDMLNYSLGAQRLVDQAYYEPPPMPAFALDQDSPSTYWYLQTVSNERYGVDELLAWVIGVTRLTPFQAFMPTIVFLHLVIICSTIGLVYRGSRYRTAALVTGLLLASSALLTFGMNYQLFGQVAGLALGCATLGMLCRPVLYPSRGSWLKATIPVAVLAAGTAEVYPEITAFVILPTLGYYALQILKHRVRFRDALGLLATIGSLTLLLMNGYLRNYSAVVLDRWFTASGGKAIGLLIGLFPYYLIPSGLANLFGYYAVAQFPSEPWISIGIGLGILSCFVLCAAAISESVRGEPVGIAALLCLALGIYLFFHRAEFALYKLAMYAQPFVLGSFALAGARLWKQAL